MQDREKNQCRQRLGQLFADVLDVSGHVRQRGREVQITLSGMKIRPATLEDAEAIGDLIRSMSHLFLVSPNGEEATRFFASLEPASIVNSMREANRSYLVAEAKSNVVGMIMVRDGNYISQFFVAQASQGRGIGRELWLRAKATALQDFGSNEFSVDSSLGAVRAYERLGFRKVGDRTVKNGFEFVAMRLTNEQPAA